MSAPGVASWLLSNTCSCASRGNSAIKFWCALAHRFMILSSGISWPPCRTRNLTRSICLSTESKPQKIIMTSCAAEAPPINLAIVSPPSVVSKARGFSLYHLVDLIESGP